MNCCEKALFEHYSLGVIESNSKKIVINKGQNSV